MFITRHKKLSIALLMLLPLAVTILLSTVRVNKPHWWWIASVRPSADGWTVTAELMLGRPKPDGTFCQRVTDKVVKETASQVTVGVQVYNDCASLLSWGTARDTAEGYPLTVDLRLRAPLAGRAVVEKDSGRRIPIPGPSGRYTTRETP